MGVLQVVADRPRAGKTCLACVLLNQGIDQGKRVAYYKPLSRSPDNDPDVAFVPTILTAAAQDIEVPPTHPMPGQGALNLALSQDLRRDIKDAVDKLGFAAELVLVEGPDLHPQPGAVSTVPVELASLLDARVLLLYQYSPGLEVSVVASAADLLGDRLAGLIINGVTRYQRQDADQRLLGGLRSRGIPVWGALPEDRAMLSVSVQQLADHLGGVWLEEPVNKDVYIDQFLIGANIMDSGPTYYGRFKNQAVITSAGRPDIQLASLMESTRCLVLTGGTEPIDYIKAEASKRRVPIILVPGDTLATAEALEGLVERANVYSRHKIQRFADLMRQNLDAAEIALALV